MGEHVGDVQQRPIGSGSSIASNDAYARFWVPHPTGAGNANDAHRVDGDHDEPVDSCVNSGDASRMHSARLSSGSGAVSEDAPLDLRGISRRIEYPSIPHNPDPVGREYQITDGSYLSVESPQKTGYCGCCRT